MGVRVMEMAEGTETEFTEDTGTEGMEITGTEGMEITGQDQHGDAKARRARQPVAPRFARTIKPRIPNTSGLWIACRLCLGFEA